MQRASDLKSRENLSPDTVRRMKAFFDRHSAFKHKHKEEPEGKARQSWLQWGGDPGRSWANKIVGQMDAADEKDKKKSLTLLPNGFMSKAKIDLPETINRPMEMQPPAEEDTSGMVTPGSGAEGVSTGGETGLPQPTMSTEVSEPVSSMVSQPKEEKPSAGLAAVGSTPETQDPTEEVSPHDLYQGAKHNWTSDVDIKQGDYKDLLSSHLGNPAYNGHVLNFGTHSASPMFEEGLPSLQDHQIYDQEGNDIGEIGMHLDFERAKDIRNQFEESMPFLDDSDRVVTDYLSDITLPEKYRGNNFTDQLMARKEGLLKKMTANLSPEDKKHVYLMLEGG